MIYIPDMNDGKTIFVFGSNTAGRHGKGAALEAKNHWGAVYGNGFGRQGMSYAIPTKDIGLKTIKLPIIEMHVDCFRKYAWSNLDLRFLVTQIGCGLAGYSPKEMAPMFDRLPRNCVLPDEFLDVLISL